MAEIRAQLIRYLPGRRMDDHVDGCHRLSVVVAGANLESARTGAERGGVGSVGLKASNLVHRNRFGPAGTTIVSVRLTDDAIRRLAGRQAALAPWRWHHGGAPSLLALRLAAALRRGEGGVAEESLRRLLTRFDTAAAPLPPASERMERIRHALEATPAANPSVDAMAGTVRMHPVSLGRAFRRTYGCSITEYRQRLRVAAAARVLLETDTALVDAALDFGFADLSHFTRVFRRMLGVPPGEFRAALRDVEPGLDSFNTQWRLPA